MLSHLPSLKALLCPFPGISVSGSELSYSGRSPSVWAGSQPILLSQLFTDRYIFSLNSTRFQARTPQEPQWPITTTDLESDLLNRTREKGEQMDLIDNWRHYFIRLTCTPGAAISFSLRMHTHAPYTGTNPFAGKKSLQIDQSVKIQWHRFSIVIVSF